MAYTAEFNHGYYTPVSARIATETADHASLGRCRLMERAGSQNVGYKSAHCTFAAQLRTFLFFIGCLLHFVPSFRNKYGTRVVCSIGKKSSLSSLSETFCSEFVSYSNNSTSPSGRLDNSASSGSGSESVATSSKGVAALITLARSLFLQNISKNNVQI